VHVSAAPPFQDVEIPMLAVSGRAVALLSLLCLSPAIAFAASPPPPSGPEPAGVVQLEVDLSDVTHKVFHVHEHLPVAPGALTLLLPKWIQGNHAPWLDVASLAGLQLEADGRPLAWRRDPVEMAAFHVDVPAGVSSLELHFDYLAPTSSERHWDGLLSSRAMVDLEWNVAVLYPRGIDYRLLRVQPSVVLPPQWHFATALDGARMVGAHLAFAETTLETLLDSPLYAGRHVKVLDLTPDGGAPVRLDVFAESPAYLEVSEQALGDYRRLVREAYALFGAHHYDHYDFLLSLSDTFGGKGLEHHRSTETGLALAAFTDYEHQWLDRDLLPHEYTHSWNGKFRRPFDTWSADLEAPLRNSLLWVYEGQTEYWGKVLAARSGLMSNAQAHEDWAEFAARLDHLAGRRWRPLQDTTFDEILNARSGRDWPSFQRSTDYYLEGALIWLDADTLIRERSHGARSLDDFARNFFGHADGVYTPEIYSFEEVVAALQKVEPYDWTGFLRERLDRVGGGAPLAGLERAGWRLAYSDKPNEAITAQDTARHTNSFVYSLGLVVGKDDELGEVIWDSPAFRAGLAPGMRLVAVNGLKYSSDRLKDAIDAAAAHGGSGAIEVEALDDEHLEHFALAYQGGNRFPHLERIDGTVNLLDPILSAHAGR